MKDLFSKCGKIHKKLRIWSNSLKKPLMENFIFCAVIIIRKKEVDTIATPLEEIQFSRDTSQRGI